MYSKPKFLLFCCLLIAFTASAQQTRLQVVQDSVKVLNGAFSINSLVSRFYAGNKLSFRGSDSINLITSGPINIQGINGMGYLSMNGLYTVLAGYDLRLGGNNGVHISNAMMSDKRLFLSDYLKLSGELVSGTLKTQVFPNASGTVALQEWVNDSTTLDKVLSNGYSSRHHAQVGALLVTDPLSPMIRIGSDTINGGYNGYISADPTTGNLSIFSANNGTTVRGDLYIQGNLALSGAAINTRSFLNIPGGHINLVPLTIGVSSSPPGFTPFIGNIYNDGNHLWIYLNSGWSKLDNSEVASAIDPSIRPLWTNAHAFSNYVNLLSGARFTHYNTADTLTNYEKVVGQWQSNVYTLGTYYGGSGTAGRTLRIGIAPSSGATGLGPSDRSLNINFGTTTTAGIYDFSPNTNGTGSIMTIQGQALGSSGTQNWVGIQPTINQTGGNSAALFIAPYYQATSGGNHYLINAGVSSAASGGGTFTQRFFVSSVGQGYISNRFSIGNSSATAVFQVSANNNTSANFGTTGLGMSIAAATYSSTSSSGTIATGVAHSFGIPTLTASNATTLTNASAIYIAGAPVAGSNVTITNPYSVYVASGDAFFNSRIIGQGALQTSTAVTGSNFVASGGTSVGNTGSSLVNFGGSTTGANFRVMLTGNSATTIGANAVYSSFIVGSSPITTPSTGTHSVIANTMINPVGTIVQNGANILETSTFYVNGASDGGTNNYALHVAGNTAASKIDGSIAVANGATINNGFTVNNGTTKLATGMVMNRTPINDVNYSILITDYIIAYTTLSGARSVTLPSSGVTAGQEFIIKDESGNAATNNITVVGTIDGGINKVLSTSYGTVKVYYNGTAWFTY